MAETRAAGTIYDLGYQQYRGARLGRLHAIQTLIVYSFRTAFGMGRGARAKFVPVFVGVVVFLPAIVTVGIASATNQPALINYARQLEFTSFLLALFVAAQAPELIVTDRQQGVLSLYLSRPMSGTDYIFAKLAAMTGAMLAMTLTPQLLLFLGKVNSGIAVWAAFKDEYPKLWPIVAGTFLTSLLLASLGLMLSSFASKRAYGSATVVAFFLLMPAATALVRTFSLGNLRRYVLLGNPLYLMLGFFNWLFDIEARKRSVIGRADIPGPVYLYVILAMCAVCCSILYLRYRKSQA